MSHHSPSSEALKPNSSFISWFYRLWKFSRPHTIIGTSLSVLSLFFMAILLNSSSVESNHLINLLGTWIACLCGNIYIVGLNQLEDIQIDQINKPHLPLASGEFSKRQGQWIVGITGILAIGLGLLWGKWLSITIILSVLIGTAYSLPPIRLKRFPLLAAFCIFTVRGMVVNLGLFQQFYSSVSVVYSTYFPPSLWLLTLFIILFTVTIALFKDVPDLEGDRQYKITTFTILLGKQAIFQITKIMITVCYLLMILAGIFKLGEINSFLMITIHSVLLIILWWRSRSLNLDNKSEIADYYQFIWKLFFLEYILFPLTLI